jgi:hypothetical protein
MMQLPTLVNRASHAKKLQFQIKDPAIESDIVQVLNRYNALTVRSMTPRRAQFQLWLYDDFYRVSDVFYISNISPLLWLIQANISAFTIMVYKIKLKSTYRYCI